MTRRRDLLDGAAGGDRGAGGRDGGGDGSAGAGWERGGRGADAGSERDGRDRPGSAARARAADGHAASRRGSTDRVAWDDGPVDDGTEDPGDDLVEEVIPLRGGEVRLLRPRESEALIDERAFAADERMPYWAELWPSSLALARRLAGRTLRGARVVELGCGLGLPSIVAARAGGRALATDWEPDALALVGVNGARNGVAVETECVTWSDAQELVARGPFDLVLASDVLYERRNVGQLLGLLPRLGATVWLADPGRVFAEEFLTQARELWTVKSSSRSGGAFVHELRAITTMR